jgi:hypothetical protein
VLLGTEELKKRLADFGAVHGTWLAAGKEGEIIGRAPKVKRREGGRNQTLERLVNFLVLRQTSGSQLRQ